MTKRKGARRLTATAICSAGLVGVLAGPAQAQREPLPIFDRLEFSAAQENQVCDFPVLVEPVVHKIYISQRPDGTAQSSGRLVFRVTDLAPGGGSVVRQVNGPIFYNGDIMEWRGVGLVYVTPDTDRTGTDLTRGRGYGLFIVAGPTTYTGPLLTKVGHVQEDLCKTLG